MSESAEAFVLRTLRRAPADVWIERWATRSTKSAGVWDLIALVLSKRPERTDG